MITVALAIWAVLRAAIPFSVIGPTLDPRPILPSALRDGQILEGVPNEAAETRKMEMAVSLPGLNSSEPTVQQAETPAMAIAKKVKTLVEVLQTASSEAEKAGRGKKVIVVAGSPLAKKIEEICSSLSKSSLIDMEESIGLLAKNGPWQNSAYSLIFACQLGPDRIREFRKRVDPKDEPMTFPGIRPSKDAPASWPLLPSDTVEVKVGSVELVEWGSYAPTLSVVDGLAMTVIIVRLCIKID